MQPGESSISIGGIADRAEKLEAAQAEAEKNTGAEGAENKGGEGEKGAENAGKSGAENKSGEQKPPVAPETGKKEPNDPVELRKWNTKISMELAEMKKQQEAILAAFNKKAAKPIDWKTLAKDPEKLEKAIEDYQKQAVDEVTKTYNEKSVQSIARYTKSEFARRDHDASYPRWAELKPVMVSMAAKADQRVNFDQDPDLVLDSLYELAQEDVAKDPNYKAPAPKVVNPDAKYTEADLAAKVKEAVDKAVAEAQKGLKAEENAAGVGGMGKGAAKGGAGDSIKKAAHAMPLNALKNAIQEATERLHNS